MSTAPSSSARQAREALGRRLRELRQEAGLTGRALASATGQHYTRVSKIEHGTQAPNEHDIRQWCGACSAEDQLADLLASARAVDSAYVELRRQARAGMKRVLGAHTDDLYERTSLFRIYEHNVIPGLFQTAEYTSAMLSFWFGFLDAGGDLSEAVAARMERQRILYRVGKRFIVLLEEQALRTWFGSASTQVGQLDRLLAVMSLPTVSLGIIPMMVERHAVGSAGFWVFDDALVALETPSASIEVRQPREIDVYVRMFEELKQDAVYGAPARALLQRTIEALD